MENVGAKKYIIPKILNISYTYSPIMHLKITKRYYKGKLYRQAAIVQGYRKGNYVSQRHIKNLGPVKNKEDETRFKDLIKKVKQGKILVVLNETNQVTFEYGVKLVVEHIWNSLDIRQFLINSKVTYDINQLIYMLVTHRLHNYGSENLSELEGYRWVTEEAYNTLRIQLRQVYRSLFVLLNKKEDIEKHLCKTLNPKREIVFYDLTSSYAEGAYKKSDIVCYGFNRDKKLGKKQIVLGLLLAESLPLAHEVWEGNTADKSTLKEAISQLMELGIKKFIFVADRGIITEPNIEWLEQEKLEYIIATKRRKEILVKKLITKQIKEEVKKVYEDKKKNRSYYLCYNEKVAKEQIEELRKLKDKLRKRIDAIKKPTEHKVLEVVGKAKRLFRFSFGKKFSYSLDKESWEYEKRIAGKYLLVTNNKKLTKEEILETYKQLMEIEYCFRQLKHFEDMRPLFHKSDNGLKAHIFLCVLTLLIEKLINKKIPDMTTREVITELRKIKLSKTKEFLVRTELTEIQQKILSQLGIQEPTKII